MTLRLTWAAVLVSSLGAAGCAATDGIDTPPFEDVPTKPDDTGEAQDAGVDVPIPTFDIPTADRGPEASVDAGDPVDVAPVDDVTATDAGDDVTAADAGDDAGPADVGSVDAGCVQMCSGVCTNTQTDVRNCGFCGTDCTRLPGVDISSIQCVAGRCDVQNGCMVGRTNCSGLWTDGCDTEANTAARCGTCTTTCTGATPFCSPMAGVPGGYACSSGCTAPGQVRCGSTCIDTTSDPRNCGGCGTVCPAVTRGTATCTMGRCGFTCTAGYGDCDGNTANGCETLVTTSVTHCGMCGNACSAPAGATPRCTAGACTLVCTTGMGDCDANPSNGCETDLRTTAANCGACGTVCPPRANGVPACVSSSCNVTCNAGFANCNATVTDGCEVELATNALNCGACGRRCAAAANAAAVCERETCGIRCNPGFGDCDGNGLNGCETTLSSNASNCGACGTVCPGATNASATCVASTCGLACNVGFGDCDSNLTNGCETDTRTSQSHCGACGRACNAPANGTATCAASACVLACNAGFTLSGSVCVRTPPRPSSPRFGSFSTSRRPLFRVALPPGQDGAQVEICANSACTSVATTLTFSGASGAATTDIPNGTYYWRARGRIGASVVSAASAAVEFTVSAAPGTSVASAWGSFVDANADGYADLAAAQPGVNQVRYYRGGTSFVLATTLSGTTGYGASVDAAGDVNGDGLGDLIVGNPTANQAFVYYGTASTGLTTTIGATLTPPPGTPVTRFGAAVTTAGDVNGDGFADLIVGAPGSNRAFLFMGSATGPVSPGTPLVPTGASSNFGVSVATLGDINADGYDDIAVGTDGGETVYLWRGSATGLSSTPTLLTAPSGASGFGRAVSGAGDVNGDGYPDVLVGAYGSGQVFVYHSGASGVSNTPTTTLSVSGALQLGFSVDGAADVNGDGYNDIVAGSPLADRAYAFFGGASGVDGTPDVTVSNTARSDVGYAVSGLGDTNRDGVCDFAIGWPALSRLQVYRGAATPSLYTTITGSTLFGQSIAWLAPRAWSPFGG
ncbi:MAG: FG-GAP-like repeat-containing protein [Polyangiales bacterium]